MTKYYKLITKKKCYQSILSKCSDVIIRQTYRKKYYMYFYTFKIKNKEYNVHDKLIFPIFQNKIKINNKYLMYVNNNNPNEYISPIKTITINWYLYGSIILFIISILLFI